MGSLPYSHPDAGSAAPTRNRVSRRFSATTWNQRSRTVRFRRIVPEFNRFRASYRRRSPFRSRLKRSLAIYRALLAAHQDAYRPDLKLFR